MNKRHIKFLASTVCFGVAIQSSPLCAQIAFQAAPSVVSGSVLINQGLTPNFDQVTLSSAESVINWRPIDVALGGGAVNILPAGSAISFRSVGGIGVPPVNFTVFNRILPNDPSRAVQFNGLVRSRFDTLISIITTSVPGGSVWFYSPGGIIAGPTAVFDIGNLVLTSNDIDTTGGLFGVGKQIRFRGLANGTSEVNINRFAQITASPAGSYVALVAPRVVQAGGITVNGSAALIGAEQADVTISNGLYNISFLAGTNDANGVVHTGATIGAAATATDPNHRIYMAAMPKNTAITLLIGGDIGFGAVAAGVVNNTVVLTSGRDVQNGVQSAPAFIQPAALGNININANTPKLATTFSSGLFARASGTVTADPGLINGNIRFNGPAVLQGDVGVFVNASQGSGINALADLSLISTSNVATGGQTLLSAIYNPQLLGAQSSISVAGNLIVDSSASSSFPNAALGGAAGISSLNGLISVTGTTTVNANATGYSATGLNGNGTGGQATITTAGALSQLNFGDVSLTASGTGGTALTTGGTPLQAGDGTGGTAQFTNGGGGVLMSKMAIDASGTGGSGHAGGLGIGDAGKGGSGIGGLASANFNLGQTNIISLNVSADGNGGVGLNGGLTNAPGSGGNGIGGRASLIVPAAGGAYNGGVTTLSANGVGGSGNTIFSVVDGSAGGSGTGGTVTATFAGGTSKTGASAFTAMANGLGGNGGDGGNIGSVGGAGGAGNGGIVNMTLSGGTLSVSGAGTALNATGTGGAGGAGNIPAVGSVGGRATGGAVTLIDSAGGNTLGAVNLLATALGGQGGQLPGGLSGTGGAAIGGSGQFTISTNETLGNVTIDTGLRGGAGGAFGPDGQGGKGGDATATGGSRLTVNAGNVTIASVNLITRATGGAGGDSRLQAGAGGDAIAGTAELVANPGSNVTLAQLLMNADGVGGGGGVGGNSLTTAGIGGAGGRATGGSALLTVNGGSVTLNALGQFTQALSASGTGGAGGKGGNGEEDGAPGGQGSSGGIGGASAGGTALVSVQNGGLLTMANPLTISAAGNGGLAGNSGGNGATFLLGLGVAGNAGGSAIAGKATLSVTNGSRLIGPVTLALDASAVGGNGAAGINGVVGGAGGNGGSATGGTAQLVVDTASINVSSLQINGSAVAGVGGAGGNGTAKAAGIIDVATPQAGNGGRAGNGGIATGGNAVLQAKAARITSGNTALRADAAGGSAGLGGVAPADMINTGAPGTLLGSYRNALASSGATTGGGVQLLVMDNTANLPSIIALGTTLADTGGVSGVSYGAAVTTLGGIITGYSTPITNTVAGTGGRVDIDYEGLAGGGTLGFTTLNLSDAGRDNGTLVTSGARGIFVTTKTDTVSTSGAVTVTAANNLPVIFVNSGKGTFKSGALNVVGGRIAISHTGQSAVAPALTIDATSATFTALSSFDAAAGSIINAASQLNITAPNGISANQIRAVNASLMALNGPITVATDLRLSGAGTVNGTSITLNAIGALSLAQANASAGALTVNTGGILTINGVATGQSVSLTSSDIVIDPANGQVGTLGTTTNVTLTNGSTTRTYIGDSATAGGYRLSNAEAQRIFSNSISFIAPTATTGLSLSTKPADLVIGTLTLRGGGGNVGATGAVNFTTRGKAQIVGAAMLANSSALNAINITAGDAIELVPESGSLSVNNNGALAGGLNLTAPDIIAASLNTFTAVSAATSGAALNDILGRNDGAVNDNGYFSANAVRFSIQNGLYIENSGVDTLTNSNFMARRGITVGAGGLTIATASANTRVFVNGRQTLTTATGQGFLTGIDFLPTVRIGLPNGQTGAVNGQSNFDSLSTGNGCLFVGVAACRTTFTDGPLSRNTLGKSYENFGFGPIQFNTLVELKDILPIGYEPLIDDPVTGAGNDDLWSRRDGKNEINTEK